MNIISKFFLSTSAFLLLMSSVSANNSFQILTESQNGDYIGQNQNWDFSPKNNSKLVINNASKSHVEFNVEDFHISNMQFTFSSEDGKNIEKGLYSPAKRDPFRGSYNGLNVSGDGRGCNKLIGSFYVHEYQENNGKVSKAAIDFVQACEMSNSKLYGSIRYNSNIKNSCVNGNCNQVRVNLGEIKKTVEISKTVKKNNSKKTTSPRRSNYRYASSKTKSTPTAKKETANLFLDLAEDSPESIAAEYLAGKNILKGKQAREFDGEALVNRAEIAKILLLSKGVQVEELKNDNIFSDLNEGEWFVKYIIKAEKLNILNGYENGEFRPKRNVNTAEFLKMLTNTFDLPILPNTYKDVNSQWYGQYAGVAQKYNLFPKRNVNFLEANKKLTRNEVAVAIYQYLQQKNNTQHSTEKTVERTKIAPISTERKKFEGKYMSFSYLKNWEFNNVSDLIITLAEPKETSPIYRSNIVLQRRELTGEEKDKTFEELLESVSAAQDLLISNIKNTPLNNININGVTFSQEITEGEINNTKIKLIKTIALHKGILYSIVSTIPNKSDSQFQQSKVEHQTLIKNLSIFFEERDLTNTTHKINNKNFSLEIPGSWDVSELGKAVIADPQPEDKLSSAALQFLKIELTPEESKKSFIEIEKQILESDRFEFRDRKFISKETIEINRREYREHVFTFREGDVEIKIYRLVYLLNGHAYFIVYSNEIAEFDALFPEIKSVINTFKIK